MKRWKLLVTLIAILAIFPTAKAQVDTLTILHLGDTHSHLTPYGPKDADGNPTLGGMARLATLVGLTRMTDPNVMLFHSGDLFVGDFMFQEYVGVAELEIMKALQYDALELGNHEFDLYPSTLEYVLDQADFPDEGFPVLCANLDITDDPTMGYFVRPYIIREVGGLRIGIFGLLTELTNQISNPAPVTVLPPLSEAPRWVDTLRTGHDCDMVILLSHLGVFEDQMLAASVSGIDIILGGHTHTVLPQPIQIGNTLITHTGEFVGHLGKLQVITQDGAIQSWSYNLLNIDSSVPAEANLAGMINYLVAGVEADPRFGPVYTQTVATAATDIWKSLGEELVKDNALGNMVADAIRDITGAQLAIQPQGFIAENIYSGPVKGNEIFRAVPYGFDQETGLGLKLVTFETDGMSIMAGLEFAVYNLPYVEEFFLHGSNLSYAYNSNLDPGSRIDYSSISIDGQPINPFGTYTVVTDDAVIPFFSQIPGFNVNNLTLTDYSLYNVVRDFMIDNSPVSYYAEGRVIDLALFSQPIEGVDALSDVVTLFYQNGTISSQIAENMLQIKLKVVRASLERGQFYPAFCQLQAFKTKVENLQRLDSISDFSAGRLLYLADKLGETFGLPDDKHKIGDPSLPNDFELLQNYPNPFNPETEIAYTIPEGSDVSIDIYDLLGQKIRTLVDSHKSPGSYVVTWNGRDDLGRKVSSGIYFYKMRAGDFTQTRKMSLMK
jgi:5'-nucleotidase/UDP-sugar diphosphatase